MPAGSAIRLTAGWVAAALETVRGTIVSGNLSVEFGGVSIDTRTLAAGDLFIAIRGEHFDGADFAQVALDAGAAGVLVRQGRGRTLMTSTQTAVIEAEDTTSALQALARAVRRESKTKVVAITGSAGKTTTKEVTGEFLAARYNVVRNRGNLNNHIGLPLSLMELRNRPDVAVVELGMNHPGEIRTLVGVAEPEVRVWTNVGEAHIGFFASVDAIADAKAEIFEGASASTLLVANADDDRIVARVPAFAGRTRTFGIDRDADVRARSVDARGIDGMSAHVTTPRGAFELVTPLVGRGNLANVLAATAVAIEFEVPLAAIAERARHLQPAARRGEIVRLAGGVTVIDDSYNANPTATKHALQLLTTSTASRRIAVLGEMLELGERSIELHEDVGRAAAKAGVDVLLTIGGRPAAALAEAAVAAGLPSRHVRHLPTSEDAASFAVTLVARGDLVLVKGSRGLRTDRVVDRLKQEHS